MNPPTDPDFACLIHARFSQRWGGSGHPPSPESRRNVRGIAFFVVWELRLCDRESPRRGCPARAPVFHPLAPGAAPSTWLRRPRREGEKLARQGLHVRPGRSVWPATVAGRVTSCPFLLLQVQGTLTPRVPWREAGPVLHTLSRKSSNKGSCVGKNGLPLRFAHTPGKDTKATLRSPGPISGEPWDSRRQRGGAGSAVSTVEPGTHGGHPAAAWDWRGRGCSGAGVSQGSLRCLGLECESR